MSVTSMAVALIVALGCLALAARDRAISLGALRKTNSRLCTYRKIRHTLGIHMLSSYPSLIASDLRMRLIKQLNVYITLDDDESEKRWERLWLAPLMQASEDLAMSSMARQDTEFAELIDGFQTNERLIADAKGTRQALVARPTVAVWKGVPDIRDSHAALDDSPMETSR